MFEISAMIKNRLDDFIFAKKKKEIIFINTTHNPCYDILWRGQAKYEIRYHFSEINRDNLVSNIFEKVFNIWTRVVHKQ